MLYSVIFRWQFDTFAGNSQSVPSAPAVSLVLAAAQWAIKTLKYKLLFSRTEPSETTWLWSPRRPACSTTSRGSPPHPSPPPRATGPTRIFMQSATSRGTTTTTSTTRRRSCPWTTPSWTRMRSSTTTLWTASRCGGGGDAETRTASSASRPASTWSTSGGTSVTAIRVITVSIQPERRGEIISRWSHSWTFFLTNNNPLWNIFITFRLDKVALF